MNTAAISKIIGAGLIVGTLDITAACTYYFIKTGNGPANVLKFVASGVFGKEAFSGDAKMLVAGLLIHYVIAFAFTIFFFWLHPKVNGLLKNRILTGIAYGIFVWVVMNLIAVPLSNVASRPFNAINAIINVVILIVCIGIPLSFMASTVYKRKI
jgi:uncharacterized protein YacL